MMKKSNVNGEGVSESESQLQEPRFNDVVIRGSGFLVFPQGFPQTDE